MFFVYPVGSIIGRGLRSDEGWQFGALGEVFTDPGLRRVVWFTLWQAVVSTVLTVAVGLPAAYCFARFEFRAKRLLWALLIVPFVLPTVVVASAVLGVVGPRSPVGDRSEGHGLGDPAGPRAVQLHGGRPDGRGVLGEPRPVIGGGGPRHGCIAVASLP